MSAPAVNLTDSGVGIADVQQLLSLVRGRQFRREFRAPDRISGIPAFRGLVGSAAIAV